jgi:hypothetical protein
VHAIIAITIAANANVRRVMRELIVCFSWRIQVMDNSAAQRLPGGTIGESQERSAWPMEVCPFAEAFAGGPVQLS